MRFFWAHLWLSITGLIAPVEAWCDGRVPPGYRAVADESGVPARMLYAVALTESGLRVGSALHPWPWTLNVGGEARRFPSRVAAWVALRSVLDQDAPSVDIGLMQISWRYHRDGLQDPWQALDPYHNLRVAAAILVDCYRDRHAWWAAVGCYHAPHAEARAARYRERVRAHWRRLAAIE